MAIISIGRTAIKKLLIYDNKVYYHTILTEKNCMTKPKLC